MAIQQTWLDELLPSKDIPIERVSRDSYISNIRSCAMAGRCIGVILNSIDDAQDTAKKLSEECPDRNVILYHERFLAEDLYRQEAKVLDAAGKNLHHHSEIKRLSLVHKAYSLTLMWTLTNSLWTLAR